MESIKKVKHFLLNNGYPENIINEFVEDCKNKKDNSHIKKSETNSNKLCKNNLCNHKEQ